eukprot:3808073-Pyramimonas_sp.AAC.1
MDDWSLTATGPEAPEALERGSAITKQFNDSIGYTENVAKRQMRVKGQGGEIEHLGLVCDPGNPSAPIRPRGDWTKLHRVIKMFQLIPGTSDVREHLAASYARPLWLWATPIIEPTPRTFVGLLYRAIIKKWRAFRVQLHPVFSAPLQACKAALSENLIPSEFVDRGLRALFEPRGLQVLAYDPVWGIKLGIRRPDDGPR